MIKRFITCLLFACFMLFIFLTLASNVLPADKTDNTFTLNINSQDVIVKLPAILPSMEIAILKDHACFNLDICAQRFCLNPIAPGHDHVDFVYTDKGEMIALVWIRATEGVYMAWKYVNGLPVPSSIPEIKALIADKPKLPKTI